MRNKERKNNIILHLPHINTAFPNDMGDVFVTNKYLKTFSNQISDVGVEELFSHGIGIKYVAPYSRIFCDVEKYINDDEEIMSKFGQGVFYTKDCNGNIFRSVNMEYRKRITEKYYLPYHKGLDDLTLSLIDNKLIIVDCHSFSEECVQHNKSDTYPDICIGFSNQYFSKELVDSVKKIFLDNGYSVSFNRPYEGTMIPNIIYDKNIDNIFCLMIEINKRVYLPNDKLNLKCKSVIKTILEYIKTF